MLDVVMLFTALEASMVAVVEVSMSMPSSSDVTARTGLTTEKKAAARAKSLNCILFWS